MSTALDSRSTMGLLTATMGGGKSWSMVRYLVKVWLPDHVGKFYCNLPLEVDAIVEYVTKRYPRISEESIRERICVFPEDELERWAEGESSMADYFTKMWHDMFSGVLRDRDLSDDEVVAGITMDILGEHVGKNHEIKTTAGAVEKLGEHFGLEHPLKKALVVIDEAATYYPGQGGPKELTATTHRIAVWLSKIRHEGARIILICQNDMQIAATLRRLAAFKLVLTDIATKREPLCGCLVSDWFQFWRKIVGGELTSWIRQEEWTGKGEKMVLDESTGVTTFRRSSDIYPLYRSRNKEGGGDGEEEKPEYQRMGWLRFLIWFVSRNAQGLIIRGIIIALVLIFIWPGKVAVSWFQSARRDFTGMVLGDDEDEDEEKPEGQGRGRRSIDKVYRDEVSEDIRKDLGPEGEKRVKELLGQVESLNDTVKRLRSEKEALAEEVARAAEVVLMDSRGVVMRNGDRYAIGEVIGFGPMEGRRLEHVDFQRRLARVSGGGVLRLFDPSGLSEVGEAAARVASVPGALSGTSESSQATAASAGRSATGGSGSRAVRTRDASSGIRPIPRSTRERVDRGSGGTRQPTGYGGTQRPVGSASTRGGSPAFRSGAPPSGRSVLSREPSSRR